MGLFAVYRLKHKVNQLEVFFEDVRQGGSGLWHLCTLSNLPNRLWLIREITDQLDAMGFELEYDRKDEANEELCIMAAHAIPDGAGSSADAIRTVCSRHDIVPEITSGVGKALQRAAEH